MSGIAIRDRVKTAIELGESHFREFKSGVEGRPGEKSKRKPKEISANISETLVAFANADGGELLVGVEDNGEITGLNDFSDNELYLLENSTVEKVHRSTPLLGVKKYRLNIDEKVLLYFSVPKSTRYVHLTSDGKCLQRSDLESVPVSAESIQFNRSEETSREYDRQFVDGVSADDLDLDLVKIVSDQIIKGMSAEKCLLYLELAEYGLSQLRLRKASLLLFAKDPTKWHPRLQVRILKVDGSSMKTGEDYNVVYDELITGNILTLVDQAWEKLRPHLTHTTFDVTAKFTQKSIYPELACKEALLNSIAHRDYSDEGRGTEVYIFRDHLEIKNPGALLSSIKIEDIVNQTGAHQSRNTYVSRVLRELGYMRELGEGMRRIYDLMNKNELAPPELKSSSDGFSITLTHKPIYTDRDLLWLDQFSDHSLDREQKSIILLGKDEKIFSAQDIWDAVGIVDTEHYRSLVDGLFRLGILKNKVERSTAKYKSRKKKIPFRQYPRYSISIPDNIVNTRPITNVEMEDVRNESCTLHVSNIPYSSTYKEIMDKLITLGEINELVVPQHNGKTKGYCFVEFSTKKQADDALSSLKPLFLDDRKLHFSLAKRQKNR
ncbi:ATP-binding protein [Hahella sp. NBU794]|uniref:ATP-binding protein n=1 Tax=Hahella sp. NBU794 TaxID=3422590 RepID=UPI003D6DC4CD